MVLWDGQIMDVQQNKTAYITGTGSGIGYALAIQLLSLGWKVVGISRKNSINHSNFTFHAMDLSDLEKVSEYSFVQEKGHCILVNNAGIIGEIGPVGKIDSSTFSKVHFVNTIAPQILSNSFLKTNRQGIGSYQIINISSGAGKYPIQSWATYCSSKAAIDLFSETLAEELKWNEKENWVIRSVAPGVVDTAMQSEIRNVSKEQFPLVEKFKNYKQNNELFTPEYVANQLVELILHPDKVDKVVCSVRDF